MGATEPQDGGTPPGRRGRRPGREAADSAAAGAASAPPSCRRTRKDVVLHSGALKIVEQECARRGSRFSETLNAMVNEWELLRGVRNASTFRRDTRGDLNAITLNAQVLATCPPGRQREAALNEVRSKVQSAKDRLVLVTAL